MARIRLFSHAASDTVNRLNESLTAAGHNSLKLRRDGRGTYRGRQGDFILNYGSSQLSETVMGQATVINAPTAITRASNKRTSFATMEQGNVRTVEYTTTRSVAEQWVREGALVYVRGQLQGHSGEGISLVHNSSMNVGDAGGFSVSDTVPQAPLYTKGILGNRREYRVHVFKGKIIHVAQKRRRDGFNEIPDHSNLVRNHHTGWIYSTQNMTALNHAGKCEALKAMAAVGLDYGAVDIITNREEAWVLEVNTAPGMEGVTLEKYTAAISQFVSGEEIVGETVANFADFRQVNNNANTTAPASRNETTTTQPQPAQQNRAVPPAPGATETTATAQPRTARSETATQSNSRTASSRATSNRPVNGGYYWLTVNGEQTIGKFNSSVNSFEIIGWEVPVEQAEVTVGARITQ